MIIILTFTETDGRNRKKTLVDHGINLKNGETVILPQVQPDEIGIYNEKIGEWVLK